jgi:hypothetical protein
MKNRIARYLDDSPTTLDASRLDYDEIAALIAPRLDPPARATRRRAPALGPVGWLLIGLGVGLGATLAAALALGGRRR